MENEEMKNQLQQSMQECEQQYTQITNKMQELSTQFEELNKQREQVRGQYTAYYNMFVKLQGPQSVSEVEAPEEPVVENVENNVEEIKEEVKEEIKEEVKEEPKVEEKVVTPKTVKTQEIKKDEEEQIKNIVKQVNKKQKSIQRSQVLENQIETMLDDIMKEEDGDEINLRFSDDESSSENTLLFIILKRDLFPVILSPKTKTLVFSISFFGMASLNISCHIFVGLPG